jgi:superfamily I DNA and RNA helicase
VQQIKQNLSTDELEADDILVIYPNPLTAQFDAAPLVAALMKEGINAHIVGVTHSRDQVFFPDSIAISGIFRAKGNEAPMVYVMNSDYCLAGTGLITKRNTLFTAITRSRAWARLCGVGMGMEGLAAEVRRVIEHAYRLDFRVPTAEQLALLRMIHRDKTKDEKRMVKETEAKLGEFLDRVLVGEMSVEDLTPEIRRKLKRALNLQSDD